MFSVVIHEKLEATSSDSEFRINSKKLEGMLYKKCCTDMDYEALEHCWH